MNSLGPQRLLITGSSGMAESAARLASSRGAQVFVVGNNQLECEALTASLPGSVYATADVVDAEQVDAAVGKAFDLMGGVDAVYNAAGLSGRSAGDGPLHLCSSDAWTLMMNVHARGTFHVCRSVLARWMDRAELGAIVNMGSVLATSPQRDYFATNAYAASKGAIEAMTISAAAYYAPYGIRLNVVAPGLVRTPMSARAQNSQKILTFIANKQPLYQNLIAADDVSRVALHLLSRDAAAITGQVVRADGGWAVSG